MNPILNTDSYKLSHYLQYPPELKFISSYIESRGGRWNRVIFYGLQAFLKAYLSQKITADDIKEAKEFAAPHGLPFNEKGWEYILKEHGGALPLRIEAVAEGSVVPTENVLVQMQNTDANVPWLVGWVETALLRAIWYPVAVATNSYFCKELISRFLSETGTPSEIDFKLHDFGARGVSSFESAGIGGSAHLLNFKGSDTISGALFARQFYGADVAAFSIPASEHSTMTAWGKEHENLAYANMSERFGDSVFACVIDSYNIENAILEWSKLMPSIKERGGRVVLRPDSGNPVAMAILCIERLIELVGARKNEKGYLVLPDFVRVIYGDGIELERIGDILSELKMRGISSDNIAFGMGGALLQHLSRDTLRFAMKASAVSKDGINWQNIAKEPISDPSKHSKPGRLALVRDGKHWKTIRLDELASEQNQLVPVFENGKILREYNFEEIRARIANG